MLWSRSVFQLLEHSKHWKLLTADMGVLEMSARVPPDKPQENVDLHPQKYKKKRLNCEGQAFLIV